MKLHDALDPFPKLRDNSAGDGSFPLEGLSLTFTFHDTLGKETFEDTRQK